MATVTFSKLAQIELVQYKVVYKAPEMNWTELNCQFVCLVLWNESSTRRI